MGQVHIGIDHSTLMVALENNYSTYKFFFHI